MSELEVARPVVAYLQDAGWEVHQEVKPRHGGRRADLVGLGPAMASGLRLVWVVEVKQSLTLDVIAQALDWRQRGQAHLVSIAVPGLKKGRFGRQHDRGRGLAYRVCHAYGIGVIEVYQASHQTVPHVTVEQVAALNRRAEYVSWILHGLNERTRTGPMLYAEAGNHRNRYWSPWRATCESVRNALRHSGPLTTRALVEKIKHHYRTDQHARSTLYQWMRQGKVPGVLPVDGVQPATWRYDPSYQEDYP